MLKWEKKVYHLPIRQKVKIKSQHWLALRRKVFKRDKYQCQKCKDFYGENGLQLNAHHIIPRPQGKTTMDNLITLCIKCHDYIELNPQMTDTLFNINDKRIISDNKFKWQQWVYGGYRKS